MTEPWPSDVNQKFKSYLNIDARVKEAELIIKKQKSARFALGKELIGYMNSADITKITINDQTIYIRKQLTGKIEDKDQFFAFLEKEGEDDIIKRVVHPKTLSSWIKNRIEEGLTVSEHVNVNTIEQLGVRKV